MGSAGDALKVDCTDLLYKVERTIKSMNYKLHTTVADDNFHYLLQEGNTLMIECVEGAHIYCKIPC